MNNGHFQNTMLDGSLVAKLRSEIEDIFQVDDIEIPRQLSTDQGLIPLLARQKAQEGTVPKGVAIFVGDLLYSDSEVAYDLIAERWRPHEFTPLLRRHKGKVGLVAVAGIIEAKPSNPEINMWMAIGTIISMIYTGAVFQCACFLPATWEALEAGILLMLAMMAILAAHEFGHYFAARYHKVDVTLPYFIPLPLLSPVGTLGAVIQLRSMFKTKRQLFDIGVAGPLGGLIFAIPLTFIGVATSTMSSISRDGTTSLEGNSIAYLLIKYFVQGQLLPSFDAYADLSFSQEFFRLLSGSIPEGGGTDILINPIATAAWFGLFITALNLLPVGQLDGGHVIYCLLGEKAQVLGLILIGAMVVAGILIWPGWLMWAALAFFLIGPGHPPPLNDLVDLDPRRKLLAYFMIFLFLILFLITPFQPL